ncbi:hypothetical protein DC74_6324 [Streptomyces noursei]|nr:hypothetical protein DC74_6324 [Streptomyces noursei]
MRNTAATAVTAATVALVAAATGGCGTGAGGTGPAPARTPSATGPATSAPPSAIPSAGPVAVHARSGPLGPLLVDGQGRALYLFTADRGHESTCYGDCAALWPPVLVRGAPTAGSGVRGSCSAPLPAATAAGRSPTTSSRCTTSTGTSGPATCGARARTTTAGRGTCSTRRATGSPARCPAAAPAPAGLDRGPVGYLRALRCCHCCQFSCQTSRPLPTPVCLVLLVPLTSTVEPIVRKS